MPRHLICSQDMYDRVVMVETILLILIGLIEDELFLIWNKSAWVQMI